MFAALLVSGVLLGQNPTGDPTTVWLTMPGASAPQMFTWGPSAGPGGNDGWESGTWGNPGSAAVVGGESGDGNYLVVWYNADGSFGGDFEFGPDDGMTPVFNGDYDDLLTENGVTFSAGYAAPTSGGGSSDGGGGSRDGGSYGTGGGSSDGGSYGTGGGSSGGGSSGSGGGSSGGGSSSVVAAALGFAGADVITSAVTSAGLVLAAVVGLFVALYVIGATMRWINGIRAG